MEEITINEAQAFENYKLEGKLLKIFTYPSAILKKVAEPVTVFDENLKILVKNMLFTMYQAPGIGLAAPQVGESIRLFVMDINFDRDESTNIDGSTSYNYSNFSPLVFINPEIEKIEGEILYEEGCLSVPGIYEKVKRAEKIRVKFKDINGNDQSLEVDETLSVCIQHENDHLDGILFLERLSPLKRNFLTKKFLKSQKK